MKSSSLLLLVLASRVGAEDTIQRFEATFYPPRPALRALAKSGSEPGPGVLDGGWDGKFLRLTSEVNSQLNQLHYRRASDPSAAVSLDFQMRISPGNSGGADGIGVAFANAGAFGEDTSSPAPAIMEEPNLAGSFGVGFDTFDNGEMDGGGSTVSLHFDGQLVYSTPLDGTGLASLEAGRVLGVTILTDAVAGGSNVSVVVQDFEDGNVYVPYTQFFIAGLHPYPFRLVFGGRTGGANSNQDLDNIRLQAGGVEAFLDTFDQDFDPTQPEPRLYEGGTPFKVTAFGTGVGPELRTDEGIGDEPLQSDGYVRLVHEEIAQLGLLAFDQTSEETSEIHARFLYRGQDGGDGLRADGAAFLLLDAGTYGASGVEGIPPATWEEPNLAGAFGLGFDTFDNGDEGVGAPGEVMDNHASLHWNGQRVAASAIRKDELDLVNAAWNLVTVDVFETDPSGSVVSVTIRDGTDGSEHALFDRVFVPGMRFPSGARVALAARTGGAADNYDLDDVRVRFGPELPGVGPFVRGECNDDGIVDLSDAVCILGWLFGGGSAPGCLAGTDTNADEATDLSDAVYLLAYLFLGGPAPLEPFQDCGRSQRPSDLALGCAATSGCGPR